MGWLRARGILHTSVQILVLGALVHSDDALPQSMAAAADGDPSGASLAVMREHVDRTGRQLEAIREEEARAGPNSVALVEMLRSLAFLHQEAEQYDLAAERLERALHVQRVNHGLHTVGQLPILDQLIAVERSRENLPALQELERRFLRIARQNREYMSTVPILHEAGDRYIDVYNYYLQHGVPAEININVGGGFSRDRGSPMSRILQNARRSYTEAIQVLLRAQAYDNEELWALERKLINSYYLELGGRDSRGREALYHLGRVSHERLAAYTILTQGSPLDFARALVELGDWNLLFSLNGTALVRYREAYDLLAEFDESGALIEELFAPETPITIPAFVPNPLVSDETSGSSGYIDVSFVVSRYGRSRNVQVLDVSGDEDAAPRRDVLRAIARNRFRPQFTGGDVARTAPLVVRYYF